MPRSTARKPQPLPKSPTGIMGLDEITGGGLPSGRTTLVCGAAGCGKTLLGVEFIVRGIAEFGEPGVIMTFEERSEDLAVNVANLDFDLDSLVRRKKLFIDAVHIDRSSIEETGEYDLEGLFVRLGAAIQAVGAKRVLLDTIETLFSGLQNQFIVRSELKRLFRWLTDHGVTAIVTGERGEGTLTRYGIEEYVSDCVILLDHRVESSIFTRRLRVVKYRGSTHGTNEFPFLIDESGISVLPVTSMGLQHPASEERVSTGVAALDLLLDGQGYHRGSSILFSGTAGTGKTTFAAHFVEAACRRGEKCLFFAFEESAGQIVRNMQSVGINLGRWMKKGNLEIIPARPTTYGLEAHLVKIYRAIAEFSPAIVVADPLTSLLAAGAKADSTNMLLRLLDHFKSNLVTALFTHLFSKSNEDVDLGVSSIVDTWVTLRDLESAGERTHSINIIKSRGTPHSNRICPYLITNRGILIHEAQEAGHA